jgi:hypothetical protein
MRCLDTSYFVDQFDVRKVASEKQTSGMMSLDLGGAIPKVVGTDGALSAPMNSKYQVQGAPLAVAANFANAMNLTAAFGEASYAHRVQLTNQSDGSVRVEYLFGAGAVLDALGGTGLVSSLSCVGTLKK